MAAIAIMMEQTVRQMYPERAPQAMHPGQWAALRFIARANREASSVAGLARYLGITLAPASRAVQSLVRKGLLATEQDKSDRRVTRLSLTPEGREVLESDPIRDAARVIAELPDNQREALAEALEFLLLRLGSARGVAEELAEEDALTPTVSAQRPANAGARGVDGRSHGSPFQLD